MISGVQVASVHADNSPFKVVHDPNHPDADAQGNVKPIMNSYNPGSSGQVPGQNSIVLVRVFYTWKLITPIFSQYFSNMAGNMRLISASVAFKNEPF